MNESDRNLEDNYTGKPIALIIGALFIVSAGIVVFTYAYFAVIDVVERFVEIIKTIISHL